VALSDQDIRSVVSVTLHRALFSYFLRRKLVNTQHLLLSKLFPDESRIRSAIGSLETSLGTGLWEQLARALAERNNIKLKPKETVRQPRGESRKFSDFLSDRIQARSREGEHFPLALFRAELVRRIRAREFGAPSSWLTLTKGSGVDLCFQKGSTEFAIDIKTVQVNAGSGVKFNDTLMRWTAYRLLELNGACDFRAHLVMPYDPTPDGSWWEKFRGRVSPLDETDVLVGQPFWELLTDNPSALRVVGGVFDSQAAELRAKYQSILLSELTERGLADLIESYKIRVGRHQRSLTIWCKHCKQPSAGWTLSKVRTSMGSDDGPVCDTCSRSLLSDIGIE
jgi:hypothetical protein